MSFFVCFVRNLLPTLSILVFCFNLIVIVFTCLFQLRHLSIQSPRNFVYSSDFSCMLSNSSVISCVLLFGENSRHTVLSRLSVNWLALNQSITVLRSSWMFHFRYCRFW